MRRLLSAISVSSALLFAVAAHADTFSTSGFVGTPPAGVSQSVIYDSGTFGTQGSLTILDFNLSNTSGGYVNGTENATFVLTLSGAFGTETITQNGTISFFYGPGITNITGFTPTSQTITGVDAFSVPSYGFYNLTDGQISANVLPMPTPEPGSLALLGTGALGLAGVVRRRLFA